MTIIESLCSMHEPPQRIMQDRYFSFASVDGTNALATTYQIRYQVYCLERSFLTATDYPDALERDEFDAHAVHALASHRNGAPAGTARLVLHSELGFPLTQHCVFTPEHLFLKDPTDPALAHYAEISRLAVSKSFRRRDGDSLYGGPPRSPSNEPPGAEVIAFPIPRRTPEIVSGIYRVLYHESKRRGITHWVVAMERSLQVILKRMGFGFVAIGPEVDYFGPVRPYAASIQALETHLYRNAPVTLSYMTRGLEPELIPPCIRDAGDSWDTMASIA